MKAEDWREFGKALMDNAELLEAMACAEENSVPEPERINKGINYLNGKGLVDIDQRRLYMSGLMLDLGANLAQQGFSRGALDLQEALIHIQQNCEGYLKAKHENSTADAERHLKRLNFTVRQITSNLRDEALAARHFIESGLGYTSSTHERINDIHSAMQRLERISNKVILFDYKSLLNLGRGDRTINRTLVGLHAGSFNKSIISRREDILGLIGRMDALSAMVRKRNRFRQVMQSVDAYLMAGNTLDLTALLDNPDNNALIQAPAIHLGGYLPNPEQAISLKNDIDTLMANLPLPKQRSDISAMAVEEDTVKSFAVPLNQSTKVELKEHYVKQHLNAMLKQWLKEKKPQSAMVYWRQHGSTGIEGRFWLLALDYLVAVEAASKATKGLKVAYRVRHQYKPFEKGSANRTVVDLILERKPAIGG